MADTPSTLRRKLKIPNSRLAYINKVLLDPKSSPINDILAVIAKHGSIEEINRKSEQARKLPNLMARLRKMKSPYVPDLEWLLSERDKKAFISVKDYRRRVLGDRADSMKFKKTNAVTLEISAFQYFPWIIAEARQSIEKRELMPGRFIRVRYMKESEADQGDLLAGMAAMQIIGASYVDTLDTKGTDGSNVHLGGPETITGYFGGIGEPNEYALKWLDEFLYYYANYGIYQALNINAGTVMIGFLIYLLGVNNEFKISVFAGTDNPYFVLSTLLMAKLFARPDGSTPLIGFNLSNSVNNRTIEISADIRKSFGFEDVVRLEHHITECYKHIVRQPYDRRAELIELAGHVKNISAKHEGGDPDVEAIREHPSDILEYFLKKSDVESQGLMPKLLANYMDKHAALNRTAEELTKHGLSFVAAKNLHA
ncbi:MAG TPA: hypothetical protein VMU35_06945 [Methylomirabilota bacterium]|nr:hypothetical protein [Methylomirabilota bacterium]